MTHICVSKLTIIGSDNGLSPGRQKICKKMRLKVSSAKRRPFCLGLNVLNSVDDGLAPNTRKRFVVIRNYALLNLCFTIGDKPSSYHWGLSLHRIYRYIYIYISSTRLWKFKFIHIVKTSLKLNGGSITFDLTYCAIDRQINRDRPSGNRVLNS